MEPLTSPQKLFHVFPLAADEQADLVNGLLVSSPNGIVVYRSLRNDAGVVHDFSIVSMNLAAQRISGQSAELMLTRTMLQRFPRIKESGLFDKYVELVNTGQGFDCEFHEEERRVWYLFSAVPLRDGFVLNFTDVTERKAKEIHLAELANTLSGVLDGSINSIMSLQATRDESGVISDFLILTANRAAVQYLNKPEREVVGQRLLTVLPQNRRMGLFDMYIRTLETNQPQRMEASYTENGETYWLDESATRLSAETLVVTFMDITESRRSQRRLEELVNELKRSNESLQQFAYVASHDLQEPLRKVKSFGDVLASEYGPALGNQGADLLRRMQMAAKRMSGFIHDLLAYSRLSAQQAPFKPVNLNQVLAEVLDDLENSVRDKKALIHVGTLPTIQGDALQLHQLFLNLLSNALKFTRPDIQPQIKVLTNLHTAPVDDRQLVVEIVVSDNGIGFDPSQSERIFQMFGRLHSHNQYSGTGVGLAIVQKIAQNHGGGILAEGYPNKGAMFKLLLPI